jgi:O-antigen/teichoic acid export membrane protein
MENKMLWMLGVSIVIIVAFYALAPFIYTILFPAYMEAVPFARMYALGWIAMATIPIGSYFAAHKKIREQYIMNISGSVIQIVLMILGVIFWGLWGLIVARVSASIANTILMLVLYYYTTEQSTAHDF